MTANLSVKKSWKPENKAARGKGFLQRDTAGTAGIAGINYFEGRLNLKSYCLVISLAGGFPQICGCKFMPEINLARATVVGSGEGSFS